MTELDTLLTRLFTLNSLRVKKWSLHVVSQLAGKLGHPERDYPCIHIAGTNGKGSVAYKIASALSSAGFRVGLFSSPHISCYRERIRINGKKISIEETTTQLKRLFALTESLSLSPRFFELTTLLAFLTFSYHRVDVAVIETGIGGRLDPTNIIHPVASVITSVDFDHCALLGNSLDTIAKEKAGIIKTEVPVIVGPRGCRDPILSMAKKKRAPLHLVTLSECFSDIENQHIARKTLTVLKAQFPIRSSNLTYGLSLRPPCRFEVQGNVIYDVAHNAAAFRKLFFQVRKNFPKRALYLFLAFSNGKEVKRSIPIIEQYATHVYLLSSLHSHLLPIALLKNLFTCSVTIVKDLKNTFLEVKEKAAKGKGIILVTGSFYIMKDMKQAISCSSLPKEKA